MTLIQKPQETFSLEKEKKKNKEEKNSSKQSLLGNKRKIQSKINMVQATFVHENYENCPATLCLTQRLAKSDTR